MSIIRAWLICVLALTSVMALSSETIPQQVNVIIAEPHQAIDSFEFSVNKFPSASYAEKEQLIDNILVSKNERALELFKGILSGDIFYVKKTKEVVYKASLEDQRYLATSFLNGKEVGLFKSRKLNKIGINNSLRGNLKNAIAELQLFSLVLEDRESAALSILKTASSDHLSLINSALKFEQANANDEYIIEILRSSKSLIELKSEDPSVRLQAIKYLDNSLYVETRNGLSGFIDHALENIENYSHAEISLAKKTLDDINQLMKINGVIENVYFGVALGAVLLLAAIGLAITFGVMGVINMAHGEMIMLGAYTTFVIQQLMPNNIGLSLVVAVPAAFIVSGIVGVLVERSVIRHLYGRPLETLLATFGVSLILQQAVRSIFGPLNQDVVTPEWMAGTFTVNAGLELTFNRLYIIIFSLMVLAGLALVLKKTLFGLQMRAVTMNRPMASSMGIKTGWVDALTFGLGSGIAGIAGVALSQLTNVGPNLGQAYIIDSFMVVVFGGVGNLWGTLVGAMSLGIANKIIEPMAGAVLAKIIVLVAIILFIQKRPRGLFALKGRAVEG
jgi:urea transport system permease protein